MAAFISPINKSIVTAHIDNNSTSSTFIGLKISGKGFFNSSNSSNNYDFNGIGFQLLSNASNYKELALIDTSNHFINSNYSSLRIAIAEQLIAIKAQTSNNNYKSLLINSNLIITSNAVGIGIGTATPVSALQIQGDLTLSGVIKKADGSLLSSSQWSNATNNLWASSNIYYNQGFVGIGTSAPQSALHVQGDITITGLLRKTDGTIFAESQWSNSFINNQTSIYYNKGFIGIGTTIPQSLLHLHTTSDVINLGIRMTNSNSSTSINDGFLIGLQSNQDGIIWNYENASIIFGTSNQERMKITNNGRIGIGTTNPQGLLDIRGDLILSGLIRKPDGTIFIESQWSNATNNLWASSNIYYNQGFVGIGTTAPQSALHVQGDITITGLLRKTDGTIFAESQWSNSFINNQTSIYYNKGFIGIGTTIPQSLLHLHTTSDVINLGIRMTNSNSSTSINDGFLIGLQSNQDGIIWNYENASIIFGTSNQERMKITNNGRIGIGTTNPQGLLDIRGDLVLGGRILNIDGTNYNLSQWSNATNNQWASSNIYYNQGFVGIGTTAPQSLLHISGSNPLIRFTDNITGSSLNSGFIVGLDSNQNGLIWSYGNSQSLLLGTSNQERLRITSDGRVGIGTTNPQATLDINGNVNITGILTINNFQITSNPTIKFNSNTFFYDNQSQLNISNFSRIINYPNKNSNTIKITSEFINISNLIISGNIYKSSNIYNSNILETIWLRSTFNNNNIYYNQGLVGIANTNPQYTLDIIGDVNITGKYKVNGADLTISSTTFSDERIKTNINDINDDSALQQILSIQPKTYNYIETKERGTDLVYGFIAQQIKEVIPEAVKLQTEFIPNIYKPYPYINNQIFTYDDLTSNLSKNDVIKIKGIDYNYLYATIIDITSNLIVIDKEITGNECFIYGKEIKDFHTLDKSYIYTLNVCAIQDLYKMIIDLQTRVNNQELEIQQLLSIVSPPPPPVISIIPILEITSNITSNY